MTPDLVAVSGLRLGAAETCGDGLTEGKNLTSMGEFLPSLVAFGVIRRVSLPAEKLRPPWES
jgi:hypothetical protein